MRLFIAFLFLQVSICKAQNNDVELSAYVKRIHEIVNMNSGKSFEEKSIQCKAFGDYLKTLTLKRDHLVSKTGGKNIEIVTDLKKIDLSKASEDQYNDLNNLFQNCRFSINRMMGSGFCAGCTGMQRITQLVEVNQKINENQFLASLIGTNKGLMHLTPMGDPIVVSSDNLSQGRLNFVGAYSGSKNFKMLNGFSQELATIRDIGIEQASAILCNFNQYISALQMKYKNQFLCGWRTDGEDFYGPGTANPICISKSEVKGNHAPGIGYIHNFDFKGCRK